MDTLVKQMIQKMDSDDWFTTYIRVNLIWDDSKYREMMDLVKSIMIMYKSNYLIPKILIYFFSFDVDIIINICRNNLFFNVRSNNISDHSKYKELVEKRIIELEELKYDFFYGKSDLSLEKTL
ncbi:hypothetical protein [Muribaculum gordoncarteri]|jgi:hypothetical protein|uniref:hypothetical protein n=1 Tax=Muribaculum gordoncarteri TaxID=2530390 RepID=UPI00248B8ADF|nr:hypothetical protein [Muribaculum gordoncarteri]